jgi:branched-chain amino acid transport system substrate-binding protein
MRHVAWALVAGTALLVSPAFAEISDGKVKIGVLTDLAGPYEQNSGSGSVEAAEEFGNKINGKTIEIIAADHQNKPDVGSAIARRWFDIEQVDAVTDLVNSAIGFATVDVAKAKNRMVLLTSAGSADFTEGLRARQFGALGLRYLSDGQFHRPGCTAAGQDVVLYRRRLYVRACPT